MAHRASAYTTAVLSVLLLIPLPGAAVPSGGMAQAQSTPTPFRYRTPTPIVVPAPPPPVPAPPQPVAGTATIVGTVHTPDGTVLADVAVSATPTSGQPLDYVGPVQTDADGHYRIGVPRGLYTVVALLDGYTEPNLELLDARTGPDTLTQDVVLSANNASVTGTVIDSGTNGPAPQATTVQLQAKIAHPNGEDYVGVSSVTIQPDGTFTLSGTAGPFDDIFASETEDLSSGDTTYAARTVFVAPVNLVASANPPLTLILPTLSFSTPSCAASPCTLTVSGTGWLAGRDVQFSLIQCDDAECYLLTADVVVGSMTATGDGRLDGSLTFDAPNDGTYQVLANDQFPSGHVAHTAQTRGTYTVGVQSP